MDDPITMPPRQLSAGRAFCNVARALQAVGVLVSSVVANVSSSLNRLGGQTPSPLPHWPTSLGPVQAPGLGPGESRTRDRVANTMPVLRCRTWERRLLHRGRGRRPRRRRGAALVVGFARARCLGPLGSGSKPPRTRESPRAQSRESLRAPIPRLNNGTRASVLIPGRGSGGGKRVFTLHRMQAVASSSRDRRPGPSGNLSSAPICTPTIVL